LENDDQPIFSGYRQQGRHRGCKDGRYKGPSQHGRKGAMGKSQENEKANGMTTLQEMYFCPHCRKMTIHIRQQGSCCHIAHAFITLFTCFLWLPI
jgi:hypothetical protein